MTQRKSLWKMFTLLIIALVGMNSQLMADGTETLGTPTINIEKGTSIIVKGVGLNVQPGNIDVTVPAGNTVKQVVLYWSGFYFNEVVPGDETMAIDVSGNSVTGDKIGGTINFFKNGNTAAYRKDITDLGLIGVGANSITISGLSFTLEQHGAGLLVILDDGVSPLVDLGWVDGADNAYRFFADPKRYTIPQTFTFGASTEARIAQLSVMAGSVQGPDDNGGIRPNLIKVTIPGQADQDFINVLASNDGDEFDTLTLDINVPAGATQLTAELISEDVNNTGALPASMVWVGGGLFIQPQVVCSGSIGDFVWDDLNGNGIQDGGEPGLQGVTVTLSDNVGVIATTSTGANGEYLFEGLCRGEYSVAVDGLTVPAGMTPTTENSGGNDAIDSDENPKSVNLPTDSSSDLTVDFGFVKPAQECSLDLAIDYCIGRKTTPPSDNDCDGKLKQLTFIYTGEGCAASNNSQDSDQCKKSANNADNVTIKVFNAHWQLIDIFRHVSLEDEFTVSSHHFGDEIRVKIYNQHWEKIEYLTIHTSCSEPLNKGDQFGSLLVDEIVTNNNEDKHYGFKDFYKKKCNDDEPKDECRKKLPRKGANVEFVYTVTNTGSSTVNNVEVTDGLGVVPGSPIASIAADESVELVVNVFLDSEAWVMVTAQSGDNCSANAKVDIDMKEPKEDDDECKGKHCDEEQEENCRHGKCDDDEEEDDDRDCRDKDRDDDEEENEKECRRGKCEKDDDQDKEEDERKERNRKDKEDDDEDDDDKDRGRNCKKKSWWKWW